MHSHFHVLPNNSVEVMLWLCGVVVGVLTKKSGQSELIQGSLKPIKKWYQNLKEIAKNLRKKQFYNYFIIVALFWKMFLELI